MTDIKNIILDLDNTIISSLKVNDSNKNHIQDIKKEMKQKYDITSHDLYDNEKLVYVVFERPHLQEFLSFLNKYFNISIWTAGTRCYACFVIEKVFKNIKVDYLLFDYHVNICQRLYNKKQPKNLNILEEYFEIPDYTISNTLIIDDNGNIADEINNKTKDYNSLLCTFFDISKSGEDKNLLKIISNLKDKYIKNLDNYKSVTIQEPTPIPEVKLPTPIPTPISTPIPTPIPEVKLSTPIQRSSIQQSYTLPHQSNHNDLGWKKVASRSRRGEYSYENIWTGERIPDPPKYPASKQEGKSKDLELYDE